MNSSFREQRSATQQDQKRFSAFSADLRPIARLFQWLASLIKLTEEEQEQAGIYLDRPGGE